MTLDELATKANAAFAAADTKRREAGRYLLEAKRQLGKGFRKWALTNIERSITDVDRCVREALEAEKPKGGENKVGTSCPANIPTSEPPPYGEPKASAPHNTRKEPQTKNSKAEKPEPRRAYTPGGTLARDFIANFDRLAPDEQEVCRLVVLAHLRKEIKRATQSQVPNGSGGDGNVVALFS